MRWHQLILAVGLVLLILNALVSAEPGQRYRIEPAMMLHLRSMESTVNSTRAATLSEHRQVAASLKEDVRKLLGSCTMQGEAHDALHVWLVPLLQSLEDYGEYEKLDELSDGIETLRDAFVVFNSRFE